MPQVNVPSAVLPDIPELAEQRARDQAAASPGGAPPDAPVPEVGLRVLTGAELRTVAEKARDFAKQQQGKVDEDDPLYQLGRSVYTLALACVDPSSDPKNPTPFFGEPGDIESAAREIQESVHLSRDGISYLAQAQDLWEDMCNPQAVKVSGERFSQLVSELSQDADARRFLALGPALRWSLMRTMAVLLVNLQSSSSSFSPISEAATN